MTKTLKYNHKENRNYKAKKDYFSKGRKNNKNNVLQLAKDDFIIVSLFLCSIFIKLVLVPSDFNWKKKEAKKKTNPPLLKEKC